MRNFFIIINSCLAGMLFLSCSSAKDGTVSRSYEIDSNTLLIVKYAQVLDVRENQLTNLSLYSYIDKWINTPYAKTGGEAGVNDIEFARKIYSAVFNRKLPGNDFNEMTRSNLVSYFSNRDYLREGDIVFFEERRLRKDTIGREGNKIFVKDKIVEQVVGIYLQNKKFISASQFTGGVKITSLDDEYWKNHFVYGGRLKQ